MNLLIDYFTSPNLQRRSEYLACIHENLNNPFITKIYVFISDDSRLNFTSPRLEVVHTERRFNFKDFFEFCNLHLPEQICIVANTDIIFDRSLKVLNEVNLDNIFVALTRWEWDGELKFMDSSAAQDAWMFKTPVKISEDLDFPLTWGRDNRIAKVMNDLAYDVRNPGKQIISTHLHISNHRTGRRGDVVPGPYLLVTPNGNVEEPCECVEIIGFNHEGQPML